MSAGFEPLMFYVGKSFIDKAKKAFNMGFVVRKPLLQALKSMGFQPQEMDRDEVKNTLDELSKTSGIIITYAQLFKEIALVLLTPKALIRSIKGEIISFLGAYDLGFSIFIEIYTQISRAFRAPIPTYIWLVVPKSPEGSVRALEVLRNIRGRVGASPITQDEWEAVQPVTESLLKSGFSVKGLTENLWASI